MKCSTAKFMAEAIANTGNIARSSAEEVGVEKRKADRSPKRDRSSAIGKYPGMWRQQHHMVRKMQPRQNIQNLSHSHILREGYVLGIEIDPEDAELYLKCAVDEGRGECWVIQGVFGSEAECQGIV